MKQREDVPFDRRYFAEKSQPNNEMTVEEKFSFIYKSNFWLGKSSVSGAGSDYHQTSKIREMLPIIFKEFEIQKLLDIPCGDFNWMKNVEFDKTEYVGADIVEEIVKINKEKYSNERRSFLKLDIIKDSLSKVDLIFCRDCMVHLSNEDVLKSMKNIKRSKSKYLMATTFTECEENEDIVTGDWRLISLTKPPFNYPEPELLISENCTEGHGTYADKCLGLWKIADLDIV